MATLYIGIWFVRSMEPALVVAAQTRIDGDFANENAAYDYAIGRTMYEYIGGKQMYRINRYNMRMIHLGNCLFVP